MSTICPAADLLVRRLPQLGVREVFGYPGGQLTPIYDAILRQGDIRHYLTRHEQAAGFMADGFARATNRPGVCLAVCGPGVYNAATPLAAAHTDSIPVLCISGQVPRRGRGLRTGYYHENEQGAACAHFTKKTYHVDDASRMVESIDDAWRTLTEGRRGPVLFEVPVDVLRASVPDEMPAPPEPAPRPAPDPAAVEAMAKLIASWKRPLILAGGGVVAAEAEDVLARLSLTLGAPVFHSANGKCAVPSDHPLHAGLTWMNGTSDLSNMAERFSPLFAQADGLLAVGCRFSQLATGSWQIKVPPSLAHIDIDPAEIGRHYPVQASLVCDALSGIDALLQHFPIERGKPWTAIPPRPPWRLPGMELLRSLRRALPRNGVVCADVTRLAYMIMAGFPLNHPRTFLHPAGAVAMGYAVPAALGAKAAYPDRKVIAVVGDGGFQMSAMELATAAQEGLGVVVLLVNDNCLTLIRDTQTTHYGDRHIGVDLANPDFEMLTRSFGAAYVRAESDIALESALRTAFDSRGTTVVEVRPADARKRKSTGGSAPVDFGES